MKPGGWLNKGFMLFQQEEGGRQRLQEGARIEQLPWRKRAALGHRGREQALRQLRLHRGQFTSWWARYAF